MTGWSVVSVAVALFTCSTVQARGSDDVVMALIIQVSAFSLGLT